MCCDICPYYDECAELEELQENCCADCPDFADCQDREGIEEPGRDDASDAPV
jgi:hypothetical protein